MEEYKGDKRKKEYREFKKAQQEVSVGVGDVIEKAAKVTGVKRLVEAVTDGCGCDDRKFKANKIELYKKNVCVIYPEKYNNIDEFLGSINNKKRNRLRFPVVRCFTEQQYNTWKTFRHEHYNEKANEFVRINAGIQKGIMIPIYAQLFARQLRVMSCCVNKFFLEIDQVYLNYKK